MKFLTFCRSISGLLAPRPFLRSEEGPREALQGKAKLSEIPIVFAFSLQTSSIVAHSGGAERFSRRHLREFGGFPDPKLFTILGDGP